MTVKSTIKTVVTFFFKHENTKKQDTRYEDERVYTRLLSPIAEIDYNSSIDL